MHEFAFLSFGIIKQWINPSYFLDHVGVSVAWTQVLTCWLDCHGLDFFGPHALMWLVATTSLISTANQLMTVEETFTKFLPIVLKKRRGKPYVDNRSSIVIVDDRVKIIFNSYQSLRLLQQHALKGIPNIRDPWTSSFRAQTHQDYSCRRWGIRSADGV